MKRFPELARRGVALALAASMSLSVFMPGALAADLTTAEEHDHDHDHVHLAAENSVDALGNEGLSDETDTALDETADAADHTWGEWTEGVTDDGQPVKLRICEDCGAVELEDGTIIGYINMGDEPELADDDQPEWYPSDFIAPLGMDDSDYALTTQGLNPDGETWNYGADYSKWVYNTSTQYPHGTDDMGNDHHSLPIQTWTSVSNHKNKAVTCTESGYIGHNCNISQKIGWINIVCHSEWKETIPTPGTHLKNLYKVPATCTEPGVEYYYCGRNNGVNGGNGTVCRYIHPNTTVITQATGHHTGGTTDEYKWTKGDGSNVGWRTEPSTCTTPGKRYRKCDAGDEEEVAETYPATGHHTDGVKWTEGDGSNVGWVVNQPYPCADGTKTRECDICHEKETVTVPATEEHQLTDWIVTVEPTCTTAGTRVKKCTRCGNVIVTETINKLGHDFQNYVDDNRPACCDQYETGTCTRCGAKDTRKTSGPIRAHKFTRYVLATFDNRLATRAYCDYEGCTAYDDKAISTDNYKENLYVLAATEASESIAKYADGVIKQAMRDAETAVKNASTREEAIASLDVIVASVRSQLLNKKIEGEVRVDLDPEHKLPDALHGMAIVKHSYSVTVTEDMVGSMLTDLQKGMDSVKEMLGSSFLSKDAIQTLIGKVANTVEKSDDINYSMRQIVYPEAYHQITGGYPGGDSDKAGEKATISNLILQLAGDLVQKDPNSETDAVQEFVSAIFDNLIDMLIEELKKDEDYSK